MKGKYFIDEIDDIVYSTDSYSAYWMYNMVFYDGYDVHIDRVSYRPLKKLIEQHFPSDHKTFLKAMRDERLHYENGYIYKTKTVKIKGKEWQRGRWVKHPKKAFEMLKKIDSYKRPYKLEGFF